MWNLVPTFFGYIISVLAMVKHTANPNTLMFIGNSKTLQTQILKGLQWTPCKSILTGKNLFSLQGTLFSLQGYCFHYRDFPLKPCTSLYGIAVHYNCNGRMKSRPSQEISYEDCIADFSWDHFENKFLRNIVKSIFRSDLQSNLLVHSWKQSSRVILQPVFESDLQAWSPKWFLNAIFEPIFKSDLKSNLQARSPE